jgi:hypothetical protein
MHEKKEEMIALREQGLSYAEIGKKLNYSKQRVFQIIGGTSINFFRPISKEACVYVGIRNWMNENKINRNTLTRMIYGTLEPNLYETLKRTLKGANCRKDIIDKLLKVTGLTYEEAFLRKDEEE